MNKNMKKIVALLMAAAMMGASFTGCSSNSGKAEADKAQTAVSEEGSKDAQEPASEGQYTVNSEVESQDYFNADNTVTLAAFIATYPAIVNDDKNAFIDQINAEYAADAASSKADWEENYVPDANQQLEDRGADFTVSTSESDFTVTKNSDGIISILTQGYSYTGGAHPSTGLSSKTYDIENQKQLTLPEVLGMTQEETDAKVTELFTAWGQENAAESMDDYVLPALKENVQNVGFYLTEDAVQLYFNQYDIAPYACGIPEAEISLSELNK